MSDTRKIERELLGELKARGIVVTPGVKRAVKDAAADAVLVERARAAINDGQPLDLDAFMRLRAAAEASRVALLGESAAGQVTKIEVEFVRSRSEPNAAELEAENERLRARITELETRIGPSEPAGALSNPPSGSPPPSADSPRASLSPSGSNVVSLQPRGQDLTDEERRERVTRLRREAGDGPQALRSAFSLDHMPHEGRGRFDFPTSRGGW
jgi:hypothetical protein